MINYQTLYKNPIILLIAGGLLVIIFLYGKGCAVDWIEKQQRAKLDTKDLYLIKKIMDKQKQAVIDSMNTVCEENNADKATSERKEIEDTRHRERPVEVEKHKANVKKIEDTNENAELRKMWEELGGEK